MCSTTISSLPVISEVGANKRSFFKAWAFFCTIEQMDSRKDDCMYSVLLCRDFLSDYCPIKSAQVVARSGWHALIAVVTFGIIGWSNYMGGTLSFLLEIRFQTWMVCWKQFSHVVFCSRQKRNVPCKTIEWIALVGDGKFLVGGRKCISQQQTE